MLKVIKRIINTSDALLFNYQKLISKINKLESKFSNLSDSELLKEFKLHYNSDEQNENVLINIFALVREASKRALNLRHYDVQLIGGLVLNDGNIAEMKTGEGKTLVSTCPAVFNSMNSKKVHIITVNEYLAKRDYELNKPLYDFLEIETSYISSDMTNFQKKIAYKASIIYGTNSEFGFDYLRDNMTMDKSEVLIKNLDFAIVDEVDSVLIDEARTPLIISGNADIDSNLLYTTNEVTRRMKQNVDFDLDMKTQHITLTETGIDKIENVFGLSSLYSSEHTTLLHYLQQSLKAHYVMKKDKDYIVREDKVEIIDQFTGRISEGRKFSNSLHQALEVKEGVRMNPETTTKATITYQNYFRMYAKLSGMTGTAYTEREELFKVYNMHTVVIPTNKPIKRVDDIDLIFPTTDSKVAAILRKVKEIHSTGQPILIGTPTIEESELFHKNLAFANIPHNTLNAKNHENEAAIIELAGQKNTVTIATNMAGRGTDIKLGSGVEELGGLYIIGTSKNENRRIDNQLRGRAGRQGDKGYTQFYLSLDDELMKRFGAEKMKKILSNDTEIEQNGIGTKFLTKIFDNAQKNLEGMNADSRKNLLEFDSVLSARRKIIYEERRTIQETDNPLLLVHEIISNKIINLNDEDYTYLSTRIFGAELPRTTFGAEYINSTNRYIDTPNQLFILDGVRRVLLTILDNHWVNFLDVLENLRLGIHLQSYGQQNPLNMYEKRAESEFESTSLAFFLSACESIYFFLKNNYEKQLLTQE